MTSPLPDRPTLPVPERHDLARFAAAFVVLTATWWALGRVIVSSSAIHDADMSAARWFVARRTPTLDGLTVIGSGLAETVVKIGITALAVIVFRLVWKRWTEAAVIAVPLVLEASVFITVTWLVKRPRPPVLRLDESPVDSSFPSGHVAAAVAYGAVVIVIAMHSRRAWPRVLAVVVTVLVASAVAFSRMYRGMHFVTDVTAGALLGVESVIVSWWILRRMLARGEAAAAVAPPEVDRVRQGATA